MFCPMCGAPVEDGAKFCPSCGAHLVEEVAPAASPADQAGVPGQPAEPAAPEASVSEAASASPTTGADASVSPVDAVAAASQAAQAQAEGTASPTAQAPAEPAVAAAPVQQTPAEPTAAQQPAAAQPAAPQPAAATQQTPTQPPTFDQNPWNNPTAGQTSQNGQTWAGQATQQNPWNGAAAPQQGFPQQGAPQGSMPGYAPAPRYPKGCLSQAIDDVLHSPGALGSVMKVALIPALLGLVPFVGTILSTILSVCALGFAIEWGRDLSRGRGFDLKGKLFRSSLFSLGFFSGALNLVLQLIAWIPALLIIVFTIIGAGGVAASTAGAYSDYGYSASTPSSALAGALAGSAFIIFLGVVVCILLSIFMTMFADAAIMHLGVTGRVESAFELKKIWKPMKSQLGKLFCAAVLPGWLVGIAVGIVYLILFVLFMLVSGGMGYAGAYGAVSVFGFVFYAVFIAVGVFGGTVGVVLTQRAMGHWAARYAPEWTHEGDNDYAA